MNVNQIRVQGGNALITKIKSTEGTTAGQLITSLPTEAPKNQGVLHSVDTVWVEDSLSYSSMAKHVGKAVIFNSDKIIVEGDDYLIIPLSAIVAIVEIDNI